MNPFPSPVPPDADDRADGVFYDALKRETTERAAFLDHACGGDTALRMEVEGMLRDHDRAGGFLSGDAPVACELAAARIEFPAEESGARIGPYKLLQRIGEGGCGVVWMAEQESPVRRRIALKIIKLGLDTRSVIARFEAERQALALMDHPNIAKVLDAGATETGRPYFVMELVRGMNITEFCDEHRLSTEARLRLFAQVCQAVQHAHQKGIIHRDLKPSNILVTLHDGVPVPRVIDFGIAKATTGQPLTDKTLFTAFEQFIGTPAYMSPEQAEMSGLDIDTRSDIYSLGVLLYELLTSQTPFDARELIASGLEAMRRTIREKEPLRPSTRFDTMLAADATTVARHHQTEAAKLSRSLRGDLDWIVMKALEKDRSRRYESASSLAVDIQRHLDHEPVAACPPSRLYRLQKLVQRNKLPVVAASAVLVSLVIGLTASTTMFFREREALGLETHARKRAVAAEEEQARLRLLAESQEKQAKAEAKKSRHVAQFLGEMLNGVGPSVALGRDTELLREILEKTEERVGTDLKDQPEVEAELRHTLGDVYMELGDYRQAEAMFRRALALRKNLFGDEHQSVIDTLTSLGKSFFQQDKFREAEPMFRDVLEYYRKTHGPGHPRVAGALGNLSFVMYGLGKAEEAESLARESLAMHRKLKGYLDPELAAAIGNLALMLAKVGRLEEAAPLQQEALAMHRKIYGTEHPAVANGLHSMALLLQKQGRLSEAIEMQRETLRMHKALLGSDHPDVVDCLNNLSSMLVSQGNLPEAEELLKDAMDIAEKSIGRETAGMDATVDQMTGVLARQGRPAEAEGMLRKALVLRRKLQGEDHPGVEKILNKLARQLYSQWKLAEAETLFQELVEKLARRHGREHAEVGIALNQLALVLSGQEKHLESEAMLRESLGILTKSIGPEHHNVATTLTNLAGELRALGNLPEAETCSREALRVRRKVLDADDPLIWAAVQNLSEMLLDQGKVGETAALYREAVALGMPALGMGDAINQFSEHLYREGKFAEAEPLYRETLAIRRAHLGGDADELNLVMASLARLLTDWAWSERGEKLAAGGAPPMARQRAKEAVTLLRECLDVRQRGSVPTHWRTADVQSRLGGALVAVAVFDPDLAGDALRATLIEAEALLMQGYEAMNKNPAVGSKYRVDALHRLVRLYTAWEKPDAAAAWQAKLNDL